MINDERDIFISTNAEGQEETIEYIEVTEAEVVEIEVDEAFPALGEPNEQLRHSLLNQREMPDQHPITAITGLRSELDYIESLKTVYSDVKNHADYYLWEDENPTDENREGYFVTMCDDGNKIRICTDDDNVFGVTLSIAGFVGGQEDIERDYRYGLTVYTGAVPVRCELNVSVGDYVVTNNHGVAAKAKGDCGYYVTAISNIEGVDYAIIMLTTSTVKLQTLADSSIDLQKRMKNAETNIIAATNVANAAYDMANDFNGIIGSLDKELTDKVDDAIEKVDGVIGEVGNLSDIIVQVNNSIAQADIKAENAISAAEGIRNEVVNTATEALREAMAAKDKVLSVETTVNDNIVAINELLAYDDELTTNIITVEKKADANGAIIQSMVANFDKYVVAIRSPRYGLTQVEAEDILEEGIIYIPTVDHSEIYDVYADQTEYEYEFTKGNHYTWGGSIWNESTSNSVVFSHAGEYLAGGEYIPYWVVLDEDVIHEETETTYVTDTLYKWQDDKWIPVATLNNSATVSLIQQESDKITLSVNNLSGSVGALQIQVDDNETKVSSLATHIIGDYTRLESWDDLPEIDRDPDVIYYAKDTGLYWYHKDINDDGITDEWTSTEKSYEAGLEGTMATIQQQADDNGASIAMVVDDNGVRGGVIIEAINKETTATIRADKINLAASTMFAAVIGDEDTITPASIIAAINNQGESEVKIGAHRITLAGETVIAAINDPNNTTTIDGSHITTGTITADQIAANSITANEIATGTITTEHLNFTPIDGSDVQSAINNTMSGLKLSVNNGEKSSVINLMSGETQISSQIIQFTGNVVFKDELIGDGTTEINGANITTGVISADHISLYGLTVNKTGTITPTFQIDSNGNVTIDGQITMTSDNGSFAQMVSDGFSVTDFSGNQKIKLCYTTKNSVTYPYLTMGVGSSDGYAGVIAKYNNGIWIGTDAALQDLGDLYPSYGLNPRTIGLFIDFYNNKIYRYQNTARYELGASGSSVAVFG